MKTMGEHLRERRLFMGLTLREVAALVDVSFPFIHDLEMNKRKLTVFRYDAMAKALHVPVETIVKWSGACPRCKGTGKR